jgi:hypothetical protein
MTTTTVNHMNMHIQNNEFTLGVKLADIKHIQIGGYGLSKKNALIELKSSYNEFVHEGLSCAGFNVFHDVYPMVQPDWCRASKMDEWDSEEFNEHVDDVCLIHKRQNDPEWTYEEEYGGWITHSELEKAQEMEEE